MPLLPTKYFGEIACDEADFYEFPLGLPAFERERRFLLLNLPNRYPLVFLQSASTKDLCFLALPILVADSQYELAVPIEDLELLDLETAGQPRIGSEVLVLALLSVGGGKPATAN